MDDNLNVTPNTQIPPNMVFCRTCGRQILKEAEICPHCGVRQQSSSIDIPGGKNKIAAGVFAILLGGIGIHKFYMGQIGKGIVYLLFFWTCIPALLGLIEGICILTEDDARFVKRLKV